MVKLDLGGGFKYFLFSPLFGEDFQFDEHIFQMGWFNHQPVMFTPNFLSFYPDASGSKTFGFQTWY